MTAYLVALLELLLAEPVAAASHLGINAEEEEILRNTSSNSLTDKAHQAQYC